MTEQRTPNGQSSSGKDDLGADKVIDPREDAASLALNGIQIAPEQSPLPAVQLADLAAPVLTSKPTRTAAKRRPENEPKDDEQQIVLAKAEDVAPADGQSSGQSDQSNTPNDGKKEEPPAAPPSDGGGGINPVLIAGGVLGVGLIAAAVGSGGGGGGGGGDDDDEDDNLAPLAAPDTASATEGGAIVTGSVATNDSDPDNDPLTFTLNAPVAGLTLNANGAFSFDPTNAAYNSLAAGQTQTVVANYTVSDGQGGSASSTLTITVTGTNDAPVAAADSFTTPEDTALVIAAPGVLGNDSDPDGNTLTAVLVSGPTHGTLTLNANGSFTYTPTANYNGPDSFTYKPNDGTADGNTVTVNLTVTPVNDAPVAAADSFTTDEDTILNVAAPGVLANDTDVEGNALTAVLVAGPAHGTLTLNANGSFSYTPDTNYNGPDSFTYKPNDGSADGNTVTVSLTVNPVNDAPVAAADSFATNEDTTLNVAAPGVLGNDTDADGDPLTAALVSGVSHGTLTFNPDGSFNYTPDANFNGSDSFTYKVNDGTVDGNTVTVNLTVNPVNDAPVAVADVAVTAEDTPVVIAVLANDSDIDGDPLTPVVVSGAAHGALTVNPDGTITYTPDANFNGPDSFTYKVNDGTVDGNTVTVNLTVTPVNDAPVALPDVAVTAEDTPVVIAVLANDSDVEGDPIIPVVVSVAAHGTLVVNPDGTITYTPDANFNGPDSFTYKPNDGSADGNTVTVSITVNPVNDTPIAAPDSYSTNEDTPLIVAAAAGVLANDTDVDGDPLNAVLVSGPAHAASFTLNPDGSFTYTPDANYFGPDSFTYKVNDGTIDGNTVTVDLTVNSVNDPPVGNPDSATTDEDTPVIISVLGNDTDVEGSPLTAVLVTGPTNGTLIPNLGGTFTYIPNPDFNGTDSFTYRPNDGTTLGNLTTVTITVNPVNDTPVANADNYTTAEDTPLVIAAVAGVLANDTDVDGDTLNAVLVSDVSNGTLVLNADGSFSYTPDLNYFGPDSFTYKVNDGTIDGNTVTVDLTVNPVNDAPVGVNDSVTTDEDTPIIISVLGNDGDVEGSPLTAVLVSGPTNGLLVQNLNGTFSYFPNPDFNGTDSFTYRPNDGTSLGNVTTVTITVNPVNDAPVAVADAYATDEDTPLIVAAAAGVLANDTDVDGDTLNAVLIDDVTNGTLVFNSDGSFSYTPNANYFGPDSFTYKVDDGTVDGNTVTVNLTVNSVNDPPVGVDDSYSVDEDSTLNAPLAPTRGNPSAGVLFNDTDVEGDPLTAVLVDGPAHGTLTLNPDGSFDYTPEADYFGPDSFTYKPNDGMDDGNVTTVSITVNPVNDPPVGVDDSYSTDEDTPLFKGSGEGVRANDIDIDGFFFDMEVQKLSDPAHGTLSLGVFGGFLYTPNPDFSGTDSFTYRPIDDNGVPGNVTTVTITVNPVNDVPVAVADLYVFDVDTPLSIAAAAGVLANDTDADGDTLNATLVDDVTNGTLVFNADGSFDYTPDPGFDGEDSFTYTVNDGTVDGNTVTVILTTNEAPVAADDSYSTDEDTTLTVDAPGVLGNDTDADSDPFTAVLVTSTAHGSLTLNPDGSFSYTPDPNFFGADSFTYKANDGTTDGNTVTVNLTVNPVQDAPLAGNDNYSTDEDTVLNVVVGGVLDSDIDPDGDPLTAILVTDVSNGTLVLNADGTFTYTPNANFTGTDSFTYKANDGTDDSFNIATVTITVNPVNDPPVAVADSYIATQDELLSVAAGTGVLANDTDIDGDTLNAVLVDDVTNGTLTLNPDGSFDYTPDAGFTGPDSFTYKVNDGTVDGNTVTVSLTVAPANLAPVASPNSYQAGEDTPLNINVAAGVLNNDHDDDGDPITAVLVTGPAHAASFTLNADGSFSYTPTANYYGPDSFTYKATDGIDDSNTVTVSLNVVSAPDFLTITNDVGTTDEQTPLVVNAANGVLSNDINVDGGTKTVTAVQFGVQTLPPPQVGTQFALPSGALLTLNADGSYIYDPNGKFDSLAQGQTATDSFTYNAQSVGPNDGDSGLTSVGTVTITITGAIELPSVVLDSRNPTFFPLNQSVDMFANVVATTDADNIDQLVITVTNVTQGANERLILDGTTVELTNGNNETTGGPLAVNASVSLSGTTATITITPPAGFDGTELGSLIDGLQYENISADPGTARRVVTLVGASDTGSPDLRLLNLASTASPSTVTEIISVSTDGVQGNANSFTGSGSLFFTNEQISSLSADARFVAFVSNATTMISGDTNGQTDVFLRDRLNGTTTRVSVANDESQANGASSEASVSNDGNRVVFTSTATNLVAGDAIDSAPGIYLRDIAAGTTVKVSLGAAGDDFGNGARHPVISGDGQFVVFTGLGGVFLYQVATGTTTLIGPSGINADISTDGRYVVFASGANNLVAGDTNGVADIFRYDRVTNTTIRVSLTDAEGEANGDGLGREASVSNDGNIIAFTSTATNLVAGDPNGATADVFVRNVTAGTTIRIPLPPASTIPQGGATNPSVSDDGRYVLFTQAGSPWIYDLQTGQFGATAFFDGSITNPAGAQRAFMSGDGTSAVFESNANVFVPTDTNANFSIRDVFAAPIRFFNDVNNAPTSLFLSNEQANFVKGGAAVRLDIGTNATITDFDSPNFDTGTLTVAISSNKVASEDVLGIVSQGTGPNQIGVSGNAVTYGGVQFATFTGGGAGGANLVFTFDADATPGAVQALVRVLTYNNSNAVNPSLLQRGITWTLVDGDGTANGGTDTLIINTAVNVAAALTASAAPSHDNIDHGILTQAQVDALVGTAIQRWEDAGATTEQLAAMSATGFTIADLDGLSLGLSSMGMITIDDNAAGWGWFVDGTPNEDSEFSGSGSELTAAAGDAAHGHMDLLTAIMHELGHQVGLGHDPGEADNLMSEHLDAGERHLPEAGDILAATGDDGQPGAAHVQGWIDAVASEMHFGTSESLDALLVSHASHDRFGRDSRSVEFGMHKFDVAAVIDESGSAVPTQVFDDQDHRVI